MLQPNASAWSRGKLAPIATKTHLKHFTPACSSVRSGCGLYSPAAVLLFAHSARIRHFMLQKQRINSLFAVLLIAGSAIAGCAPSTKTTTTKPVATVDTSSVDRERLLDWLRISARRARSLSVSGDISLDQSGSANSATFDMKSKRARAQDSSEKNPEYDVLVRVDSLSIEVKGPFGIKVARFLASPVQYQFYDILHGETFSGAVDSRSLEALTHLDGVSLPMMGDLIYGLVPDGWKLGSENIAASYITGSRHTYVVHRTSPNITETIDIDEADGDVLVPTRMRYRRWNGNIADPLHAGIRPALWVDYSQYSTFKDVSVPGHIEAVAGENKLTMDYKEIDVNPASLTVHIKMPK